MNLRAAVSEEIATVISTGVVSVLAYLTIEMTLKLGSYLDI